APLLQRRAADDDQALTLSETYTPAETENEDEAADTAADDPNLADPPRVPAVPRSTAPSSRDSSANVATNPTLPPTAPVPAEPSAPAPSTDQPTSDQPSAAQSSTTAPATALDTVPRGVPPLPQPPTVATAEQLEGDRSKGALPVIEEVEVADGPTPTAEPA